MNGNTVITRAEMTLTHADVRKCIPGIKVSKAAWVHKGPIGDSWEFHVLPNARLGLVEFYWHGSAYDAYEARAKGWNAYLTKFFPDLPTLPEGA